MPGFHVRRSGFNRELCLMTRNGAICRSDGSRDKTLGGRSNDVATSRRRHAASTPTNSHRVMAMTSWTQSSRLKPLLSGQRR